jgi:hypothetical protein
VFGMYHCSAAAGVWYKQHRAHLPEVGRLADTAQACSAGGAWPWRIRAGGARLLEAHATSTTTAARSTKAGGCPQVRNGSVHAGMLLRVAHALLSASFKTDMLTC